MGCLSPELTIRALVSVMKMICVDDSSLNLLSKCQACPILGLVSGTGSCWLFGFSGETSEETNNRPKEERHQRADDPKTEVRWGKTLPM